MLTISEPQVAYEVDKLKIHRHLMWLRNRGMDVHEFATSYVNRTVELGYAPDLEMSASEFAFEKSIA